MNSSNDSGRTSNDKSNLMYFVIIIVLLFMLFLLWSNKGNQSNTVPGDDIDRALTIVAEHESNTGANVDERIIGEELMGQVPSTWAISFGHGSSDDGLRSVFQNKGGEIVAAGYSFNGEGKGDMMLAQISLDGTFRWQKTFGGGEFEVANSVVEMSDGRYLVAGRTYSFSSDGADGWLSLLDAQGDYVWHKIIEMDNSREVIKSAIETSDGGIVIAYVEESKDSFDGTLYVVKLDENGREIWNKQFVGKEYGFKTVYSVTELRDSSIMVIGNVLSPHRERSHTSYTSDAFAINLSSEGGLYFSNAYGGYGDEYVFNSLELASGNIAIVGFTDSYGAGLLDGLIYIIDSTGNLILDRVYGGNNRDIFIDIQLTSDNSFTVLGSTGSFGYGGSDLWLLNFDGEGLNRNWERTFGSTNDETAYALEYLYHGGYLIGAETDSFNGNDDDAWLLKLNSNGEIPGFPYMDDSNAEASWGNSSQNKLDVFAREYSIRIGNTNVSGRNFFPQEVFQFKSTN